jgi:hypothetical protein
MAVRTVLAVVTGYVIFAGSAVLLFQGTRVDPHAPAPLGFMIMSVAYGIAFGFLSGFVAGRIGGRAGLQCGIWVAAIIALGAAISLIARPGTGALWTQISAIALFAPAALLGDYIRKQRTHAAS